MPTEIHLLQQYANHENLKYNRESKNQVSTVEFSPKDHDLRIKFTETNSLIEEKYCLSLESAKFELEGSLPDTDRKNAMIHQHPKGHPWKHLQFTLYDKNDTIRIDIEPLDEADYVKCIKGFIHISQDILNFEKDKHNLQIDLKSYFFNETIAELADFRRYLLNKVGQAYNSGKMFNDVNEPINQESLEKLQSEPYLLPFLNWN